MTTKFNADEARALVERLTGFTPGPWREWDGMIQNQSDWIDQNGTRHTDWNFPGIITEMPDTWESRANGYLIADAPDLHRHLTAALAEIERLREALKEISCTHVTDKPLWWQAAARAALAGETDQ